MFASQDNESAQSEGGTPEYRQTSEVMARAYIPDDTRPIIAGDVLRFQVFEDEESPVYLRVNDQGYVDFPYVGRFKAQGLTCQKIVSELKTDLEKTYYYKATVFVAVEQENPIRGRVYIVGEIANKGPQGIPANVDFTLSKAILAAGGFTSYAKESRVRVIRDLKDGSQKTFEVDVEEIFETGDRDTDIVLEPNDFIIVPKSMINFK